VTFVFMSLPILAQCSVQHHFTCLGMPRQSFGLQPVFETVAGSSSGYRRAATRKVPESCSGSVSTLHRIDD
jgi:hypothetical protein